jgi:hypothetical protein
MRPWRLRRAMLLATSAFVGTLTISAGVARADTDASDAASNPTGVNELVVVAQAVHVSPSSAPLQATQPTSAIQKEFIANNIIPLASYDDIIKFAPSVWDQSPNGPGLGKSETLSIRGSRTASSTSPSTASPSATPPTSTTPARRCSWPTTSASPKSTAGLAQPPRSATPPSAGR